MRHKKLPDWIHLKYDVQPPQVICSRCGETRTFHLPATIEDAILQSQAFADSHKYCKTESNQRKEKGG